MSPGSCGGGRQDRMVSRRRIPTTLGMGALALGPATGQPPCSSVWLVQVLLASALCSTLPFFDGTHQRSDGEDRAGADPSFAWSGRCRSPAGDACEAL